MIKKIIFPIHLVLFLWSVDAFATIYDYRVSGQFEAEGTTQYVSGDMQISDEFLFTDRDNFDPEYYFEISSFNLTVYGGSSSYIFSGPGGVLDYIHQITDPMTGYKACEEQWWISSASGDFWSDPYGDSFLFYTSEMTAYDPVNSIEYYGILAPTILLWGPTHASQYSQNVDGGQIWLTRVPAPVPEPATMLLLATGLVVPFVTSGRRRKNETTPESDS